MKRKVLIITYYWPPAGGAGVQRWLKFTKYLRHFNWEPIIYTSKNPNYPNIDKSLLDEVPENLTVIKNEIWEPYRIYRFFTNRSDKQNITTSFTSEKKSNVFVENLSNWIRSNFFIPDARKFWIKPSVRFLNRYLRENNINVIITTGPPHSLHLIGLNLKKLLNIKWVADFRDPWTNIDYFHELRLTFASRNKHHRLEKKVLMNSDMTLVVGNQMKKEFIDIGAKDVEIITNGFDHSDVNKYKDVDLDEKFSMSHIGIFMRNRNPQILWAALNQLVNENSEFKKDLEIKLIGNVDYEVIKSIRSNALESHLRKFDYMPHDEIIKFQKSSQVLLLLINKSRNAKGMLTGKFFEYLASGRPILAVGPPDGDAAKMLNETGAGVISDFDDIETLKENIMTYYSLYKKNNLYNKTRNINKYSRENLTEQLSMVLNNLIQENK